MTDKINYRVEPGGRIHGEARVPGDKSISHRAIMLGSLADGEVHISGFLEGEDALATLQAFRALGVKIKGPDQGRVVVRGAGLHGLRAPRTALDLGNSGTSMRLMAGLLSGQPFATELTGDASLSKRPMRRVIAPLTQMGARISGSAEGFAPLQIQPAGGLHGIDYTLPVASAQIKSCILLAGLYAQGTTCVTEPGPTRDHTERMLRGFGWPVEVTAGGDGQRRICVHGGHRLQATDIDVPADISSAAFFMVGASIAAESVLVLKHVGVNPTRTGVIEILRLMGADLTLRNQREVGGEPVADIEVRSSQLHGIEIPAALVPLAIDEFPVLFVAAACARGRTVLTGAEELRVKESDRIQVMADGLNTLGIQATPTADGIVIEGGRLQGGEVDSHGDHRIAMAFAIAALRAAGTITIGDCANVATSFPGFAATAAVLGLRISDR